VARAIKDENAGRVALLLSSGQAGGMGAFGRAATLMLGFGFC